MFFLNPSAITEDNLPPIPDWTNLVFNELFVRISENYKEKHGYAVNDGQNALSPLTMTDTAREEIFSTFDKDQSGEISKDEFIAALKSYDFMGEGQPALTNAEIDILVSSVDRNQDGSINIVEFWDRFQLAANSSVDDPLVTNKRYALMLLSKRFAFPRSSWLTDDPSLLKDALPRGSVATQSARAITEEDKKSAGDEDCDSEKCNADRPEDCTTIDLPLTSTAGELSTNAKVALDLKSNGGSGDGQVTRLSTPMGDLEVSSVSIWPPELEQGIWPDTYTLSDHGLVSTRFKATINRKVFLGEGEDSDCDVEEEKGKEVS